MVQGIEYIDVSKCSLYTVYNNPALLNGSTQFHYCTDSNPGTGADDAFVLKRGHMAFTQLTGDSCQCAPFSNLFFSRNILTACLFTYSLFT